MLERITCATLLMAMAGPALADTEWKLLATDLVFPEGPAWSGDTLFFSSCEGEFIGQLKGAEYSVFLAKDSQRDKWQRTNGLTVGADGNIYACDYSEGGGAILRISPGAQVERLTSVALNRPNDLAFAPGGALYFTDPNSYSAAKPDGVVYRLDVQSGTTTRATEEGFCFPNGIAFSPDGSTVFMAESAKHRVVQMAVNADGTLGPAREFVAMPGGDPDGMAFDADGNLYVAHFGGGHVWVISPAGEVLRKIGTPGKKPSNVEFGGADMRTLFITEDETNAVYSTRMESPGFVLHHHPLRSRSK